MTLQYKFFIKFFLEAHREKFGKVISEKLLCEMMIEAQCRHFKEWGRLVVEDFTDLGIFVTSDGFQNIVNYIDEETGDYSNANMLDEFSPSDLEIMRAVFLEYTR